MIKTMMIRKKKGNKTNKMVKKKLIIRKVAMKMNRS